MMDLNELKNLPIEELRDLARKYGMNPHHNAKAETLANLIVAHASEENSAHAPPPSVLAAKPVAVMNTADDVRDACAKYLAKPDFEARFTETTWHFRYKGSEDSGHLSVPLRVIKMKAETVSKGARRAVTVKNADGQDVMMTG